MESRAKERILKEIERMDFIEGGVTNRKKAQLPCLVTTEKKGKVKRYT